MSNYIIPPRLHATDYAKGKLTQDEIIALQIANDANIAKARKALKMGEIQQLPLSQTASPEELIADIASQEATARSNLEKIGFRPQEAAQIITTIRSDPTLDFVSLNANFPAIEADIKRRFNIKLLTPSFFLDYFRKYSQLLDASTGMTIFDSSGVDGLVNTISEIKTILPSRNEFNGLFLRVGNINARTKETLERLQNALPSDVDYDRIQSMGAVERLNIINQLADIAKRLPSKEQVESADTLKEVNDVANSIPNNVNARLEEILSEARSRPLPVDYTMRAEPSSLKPEPRPRPRRQVTPIYTTAESKEEGNEEEVIGKGIMRKPKINLKLKVGRGLAVKETPSYREYGKYAIHIPQLEQQDILNVKYKSLGQIPKYKPIPVSDVFRDFILDLLENGKPNVRVYTQISPDERKLFEEMSIGAGVWNGLGLKRTTISTDEEENKRFEILRGEYLAGNNNPKLLSELRKLVVKMMNDGRIKKRQGLDLLMELSA